MDKFFAPASVAAIGASATPGKPGNVLLKNIRANGFTGRVYPVNPRGGIIEGYEVLASIDDLPAGIDQAVVTLPAAQADQTVRALAARGIAAIVLAASGFAEVDEMGEDLQAALTRTIRETGVRVLGPNTTGHVSTPAGYTSSFFPLGKVPRGNVSYIAQTGNFCGISLRHIMSAEHFGICRSAGLGNKIDIDESDILGYLGDDDETRAVLMYLESIKRPREFVRMARQVTRKKPVIMLKGGATAAGAAAAVAHTASLAADDRLLDGALHQAGVARIYKYSQLFHVAQALASMPPPMSNRISIVSPSGALAVCMTDLCRSAGLDVAPIHEKTRGRVQDISPSFIRIRNPVDIFGAVNLHGYAFAYRTAMEAVLQDPNIDSVVAIMLFTDETGRPPLDFIVDLARDYPEKPILVTFMGQHEHNVAAKTFLDTNGVPAYMLVEEPFEVLGILARCRAAMKRR